MKYVVLLLLLMSAMGFTASGTIPSEDYRQEASISGNMILTISSGKITFTNAVCHEEELTVPQIKPVIWVCEKADEKWNVNSDLYS